MIPRSDDSTWYRRMEEKVDQLVEGLGTMNANVAANKVEIASLQAEMRLNNEFRESIQSIVNKAKGAIWAWKMIPWMIGFLCVLGGSSEVLKWLQALHTGQLNLPFSSSLQHVFEASRQTLSGLPPMPPPR
jgi:hypothetical protein